MQRGDRPWPPAFPRTQFIRDADELYRIMGIVSSGDPMSSAAAASARRAT
jgi:hypothetical protein